MNVLTPNLIKDDKAYPGYTLSTSVMSSEMCGSELKGQTNLKEYLCVVDLAPGGQGSDLQDPVLLDVYINILVRSASLLVASCY